MNRTILPTEPPRMLGMPRSLALSVGLHVGVIGCALAATYGELPRVLAAARPTAAFEVARPEHVRPLDDPDEPLPEIEELPDPELPELAPDEPLPLPDLREPVRPDPLPMPLAFDALAAVSSRPIAELVRLPSEPEPLPETVPETPQPPAPIPVPATPAVAVVRAASLLHAPGPDYPRLSQRLTEEGTVVLAIDVTRRGTVDDVEVRESSGYPRLDDAAVSAARTWRFRPALEDGREVQSVFVHRVTFELQNAP